MKKLITAAIVALSFAGTAAADPVYMDVGVDFGGNANTAAGSTTTGWVDQLSYLYTSTSKITDNDGNSVLSAGDTIVSKGGIYNDSFATGAGGIFGLSGLVSNSITSFEPLALGPFGPSENDLNNDWGLTFGFTDLMGFWTGTGMVYTSGTIEMYYYELAGLTGLGDLVHLFDLNVAAGGDTGTATVLGGTVSNFGTDIINGVAAGDVFNSLLGGFEEFGDNVYFGTSQDTQPLTGLSFVGGVASVSGSHNGSLNFQVPEPTSIAILGLGLLGFAGARRRKS